MFPNCSRYGLATRRSESVRRVSSLLSIGEPVNCSESVWRQNVFSKYDKMKGGIPTNPAFKRAATVTAPACVRCKLRRLILFTTHVPTFQATSESQKSHTQDPKAHRLGYCSLYGDGSPTKSSFVGGSIETSGSNRERD